MSAEDEMALIELCAFLGETYDKLELSPIAEENLLESWRSIRATVWQMRGLIDSHRKTDTGE